MRRIKQLDKRNCGQIAVAVLTNIPLIDVENFFGHTHGTKTKDLIIALRRLGFSCPNRRKSVRKFPSDKWFGIVHTRAKKSKHGGHWIVVAKGKVWDGCADRTMCIGEYVKKLDQSGWRITAILPVW